MSIVKVSLSELVREGRVSTLWGLFIATICVCGILFSVPLHIEMLTSQLATIAELSVPSSLVTSMVHTYFQEKKP